MIHFPAKGTLRRYGLTFSDWSQMVFKQCSFCAVCGNYPKNDRLVIDHEHVRGWKKMKPAERRKYVRGLLCNRCNWQFLRRGMTCQIATGLVQYLTMYESGKKVFDSQASPV